MRHSVQALDCRVQPLDHSPEPIAPRCRRLVEMCRESTDVAARHEVLAGALHDDDTQRVVGGELRRARDQRVDHRVVERVERAGPIERQRRDGPVASEQDGVVHRVLSGLRDAPRGHARGAPVMPILAPRSSSRRVTALNGLAASSSSTACATSRARARRTRRLHVKIRDR
jgi:hypothetical protein